MRRIIDASDALLPSDPVHSGPRRGLLTDLEGPLAGVWALGIQLMEQKKDLHRAGDLAPARWAFRSSVSQDRLDGLRYVSCVSDLYLAGLGLLDHGNGDGEHAVFIRSRDLLTIKALPEEELAAEVTLAPLCDLDLIVLGVVSRCALRALSGDPSRRSARLSPDRCPASRAIPCTRYPDDTRPPGSATNGVRLAIAQ